MGWACSRSHPRPGQHLCCDRVPARPARPPAPATRAGPLQLHGAALRSPGTQEINSSRGGRNYSTFPVIVQMQIYYSKVVSNVNPVRSMEIEQTRPFCFVCYAHFYNDGSQLLRERNFPMPGNTLTWEMSCKGAGNHSLCRWVFCLTTALNIAKNLHQREVLQLHQRGAD